MLLLAFGTLILIPTWLVLPPDDEDLYKEISSTVFQSRDLFLGRYPFWDPRVAFGVPQPLSQTLNFHPFLVLAEVFPLGVAIGVLYQLQIWIGVLSVWAIARHLGIGRSIGALCAITYALSSPTLVYLRNFWPVIVVQWTLAPLLLLLLLKLIDSRDDRWARASYALGAGLCSAFMILDGHAGVLPDIAIPFAAFLAVEYRRVREVWPWLLGALGLCAIAGASRVYDIGLEASRSGAERAQEVVAMDFWRLLLYPIPSPFGYAGHFHDRSLALGGPFLILAAVGMVYRRVAGRHADGLRAGVTVSFVLWFIPLGAIPIRSGNFFAGGPFVLFALFLAGLTLQTLWERLPQLRRLLAGAAVLQAVALIAGWYPGYHDDVARAGRYLDGKPVESLKRTFENQPIYAFFEQQKGIRNTRVYMAAGAEDRLFRNLQDYEFAGWSLHDLRLVNGTFKGIGFDELAAVHRKLKGEIRSDVRVTRSALTLDVLDIGYVLATPEERVAPSLERIKTFRLSEPDATIVVYRNPDAWPDAVVLTPDAKALGLLPRRPGCDDSGLLCADFGPVARIRAGDAASQEGWRGSSLALTLAPAPVPRVLMVSQLYRPGWRARFSDGRTVDGYRVLGGFTGFDLPPGVDAARVFFRPLGRVVLTSVSWAAILAGLLAVLGIPLARRSAKKGAARTRS